MFFRIYPLDERGRYLLPQEVECDRDEDAVVVGASLGERVKHGFDLWHLGRFAGSYRLDGEGKPVRSVDAPGEARPPP